MHYGLDVSIYGAYADASLLADLAVLAEEAGWDGFFVQDGLLNPDHEPLVDPWIALSAIAVRTRRLRIGAFMAPLAAYKPWQVARQAAALDHLSGGRLIFGAGLGEHTQDFSRLGEDGDPRHRAAKLDEGLDVLRGLWSGETFSFHGTQYALTDAQLLPGPLQSPSIPIWVAGQWPHRKPLRRAARFDGIYIATLKANGEPLAPAELNEALDYIASLRLVSPPFELAFAGETPAGAEQGAQTVRPFAAAGVTWWLEGIWPERGSPDEMRRRIRQGPPR